jgi:hypothetical protein
VTAKKNLIVMALALAAAAAGPGEASASKKLNSFEGSCSFEGTASFSPPATNTQQSLDVRYDATGTCSGTLNGRTIASSPVTLHQAVRDVDGSCQHADTTRPGHGAIAFADGTTITYTFEFHFPTAAGTFTFQGTRSGTAHGAGSLITPRTPSDVVERCAGEGVAATPLDASLATDTPLVSAARKHGRRKWRASSFRGTCELSGAVAFHPPLTNDLKAVRQRVRAPGACSGTFTDRRGHERALRDSPSTFVETSRGNGSCNAGTATGSGTLRFRYGKIRFAFAESRASGAAIASATGARTGSARGIATVSQSENPATIAQRCAGSGLKRVRVDIHLATTPSISG